MIALDQIGPENIICCDFDNVVDRSLKRLRGVIGRKKTAKKVDLRYEFDREGVVAGISSSPVAITRQFLAGVNTYHVFAAKRVNLSELSFLDQKYVATTRLSPVPE